MRAVATLTLLLAVVPPIAAQPLRPALKLGSMQSGGYCAPLLQRAAVDRKAWIRTKPADSEKSPPALSIPATLGRVLINAQMLGFGDEAEILCRPEHYRF